MPESSSETHAEENCPIESCPLGEAHDRLIEASYFLHQMAEHYHNPAPFRYNGNAFLSSLKSTTEMLRMELERSRKVEWFKANKGHLSSDPVLSRFMVGRNIVLHQRPLLRGSKLQAGIFRGRKLKLAFTLDVSHDRTTMDILENTLKPAYVGFLIDEEHSAIGEQLGIQRYYHVGELHESSDVLSVSYSAFGRMTRFVARAHEAVGGVDSGLTDETIEEWNPVDAVSLLLEGDLDPDAYERWGWVGAS
ncbi:hypothetical protein [Streptomyces sp. NPDC087317]|uniref:hypothetical protein n=1 Tax=Streptomyces sp. NPDC087317 TaxID=3365784 RepID=UPI0037FE075E